jgi:hypothetical protein
MVKVKPLEPFLSPCECSRFTTSFYYVLFEMISM